MRTISLAIKEFLKLESASGMLLIAAAVTAMVIANSPLSGVYALFIDLPVQIRVGPLNIAKPLLLWINDGLMAVFFLLVGLELKREALEGELSDRDAIMLPAIGALGGMAVPAGIYVFINWGDSAALGGWAIPAATDIAFALGILSLLGSRVPVALKIFLTSLAIFDDVGAIIIIAVFYSADLSLLAVGVALLCMLVLWVLNRMHVSTASPFLLVGAIMWVALLKSGVHATLAGVVLALFIPMRDRDDPDHSPVRALEHDLHTAVAFGIVPLFAFANAGVSLAGVGIEQLMHGVPLGIALGLILGKQAGVFGFCALGIAMGLVRRPQEMSWGALYGVSLLCGIGFTMSLFIGSLAFESSGADRLFDERLGIIAGSLVAALTGYAVLRRVLKAP